MEIIKTKNYQERSQETTAQVVKQLSQKPDSVLVFPADTTHAGMYAELGRLCQSGDISFKGAKAFHLDEYVGIEKNNPKSFRKLLDDKLFKQTDFRKENIYFLDGDQENLEKVCENYENRLNEIGPADLCILGIGRNGHIAFDEPGVDPEIGVHRVKLDKETVKVNQGPQEAITLGVSDILKSKKIILSASGQAKAEAIKRALIGPISSKCPASFLRTHQNITFILDKDAASLL